MTGSIYCLDNDILLKLATCGLFEPTLKIFEVEINRVKILETFSYKFRREQNRKRTKNPVVYNLEAALTISEACEKISEEDINQESLILLGQNKDDIQAGEAILISYVSFLNQKGHLSYLLTGDKKCLRALNNPNFSQIIQPLEQKIWCLEQLILKDIEVYGFDEIQEQVYPVRDCDTNLKLIFGYSRKSSENEVTEALRNEILLLKQETGHLLYPYPN